MPVGASLANLDQFTIITRQLTQRLLLISLLALLLSACEPENMGAQTDMHLKRSQAYQGQGQYRAAIIEARNAVRLDPERIDTHTQLAIVYNQLGYYRTALKIFAQIPFASSPAAILQKATSYNALRKYRSSLRLLSQHRDAPYDEEQTSYYRLLLGEALIGSGRTDEGRLSLQQAATGAAHIRAQLSLAQLDTLLDNPGAADEIIQRLLATNPHAPEVLLLAGKIAAHQGEYEQAEDYLSEALSYLTITDIMLPQRISTLQMLSRVLTMRGRPQEAMAYNRILAESVPEFVENRSRVEESLRLIEEGNLEEAETLLLSVLAQGGGNSAGTLLGMVKYMQGDLNEASELLSTYLDPETADVQAIELLVSAKFKLNELDQVLAILTPEVKARSKNPDLLGLYGLALIAKKDVTGVKYIKESLELNPVNGRLRLSLATFYEQQGNEAAALEQARLAYSHEADSAMVQGELIRYLLGAQRNKEAQKFATKIAADNSEDSESQTMAGLTFLRSEKLEEAVKYLHKAVEIDQDNATAWLALSRIALTEGDFESAQTYSRYVAEILPYNTMAYKAMLSAFEGGNNIEQGITSLQNYARNDPGNGVPLAVLAEFYFLNKQFEIAQTSIEEALARQTNNNYILNVAIATYSQSARIAAARGDMVTARQRIAMGLSYLPNAVPLLEILARIEITEGNQGAALAIAASLEQTAPAHALEITGDALNRTEPVKALNAYDEAWRINPNPGLARKTHRILERINPEKAAGFKQDWADSFPNDPGLLFVAAVNAQNNNDRALAVSTYEQLLQVQPNHITALNNLAWLYYENKNKKALQLAQHAAELAPENAAVLDTYGVILVGRGQLQEGIDVLQRAYELAPDSAEIRNHLEDSKE